MREMTVIISNVQIVATFRQAKRRCLHRPYRVPVIMYWAKRGLLWLRPVKDRVYMADIVLYAVN